MTTIEQLRFKSPNQLKSYRSAAVWYVLLLSDIIRHKTNKLFDGVRGSCFTFTRIRPIYDNAYEKYAYAYKNEDSQSSS